MSNTADLGYNIRFKGVSKRFGDFLALDNVSFEVKAGSVHAVFGENGAGKTTLMRTLAGIIESDTGEIFLNSSKASISSPCHASMLGIGMVHQHLSLIPAFTVLENIILEDPSARTSLSWAEYEVKAISLARSLGIEIDTHQPVWKMSHSARQWAEIFRLLFLGRQTLILDEPTSVLSPLEIDQLLGFLNQLAEDGKTVLLITHKLQELEKVADRVTVLRRGRNVATLDASDMTLNHISDLATGISSNEMGYERHPRAPASATTALSMHECSFLGPRNQPVLENFSLELRHGMIVGIAGVSGNGQQEIAETVAGLRTPDKGVVDRNSVMNKVSTCRYVPAERLEVGCVADMGVTENLVMRSYADFPITSWGIFMNKNIMQKQADALAKRFSIKHPGLSAPVRALSGGNIQRLILARELHDCSDILVAHEPTSGLDIEGTKFVRECLIKAASQGVAVMLLSSDIDEILEMSDFVVVLYSGRSMGIYPIAEVNRARIGNLMLGREADD